ncbi:Uncharacterised protein [Mycobacteroides abscessus]|nr:Uncharacterised protein [Mycobacteroides abscessus]SKT96084.1 Uncharacterised protein [Mycobacteroides abscessus subsp. abscessus]
MGRNQSSKFEILSRISWMVPCRVCMSPTSEWVMPAMVVMLARVRFMMTTFSPILSA